MTALQNLLRRFLRPDILLSTAYLACLIAVAFYLMRPVLFRSWFFMSDEYVFAAEVIRFSNLDFHQHFFDNPGTPFMMLNAVIWGVVYVSTWAFGLMPPG